MTVTRNLLRNYTKLWWHRCLPVEAMRSIAFRNRDHFFVTSVRLGVSNRADPEATAYIFDKMLQDQGREQTEEERWVLGWASRASWEVYMCLLYALVEQYKRIRRDHPSVAYQPLDDYLQSHEALVDRLQAVRDKLLHPLKRVDYLDSLSNLGRAARHASDDLYLALEQLQNQLDDFLERLREVLHESLGACRLLGCRGGGVGLLGGVFWCGGVGWGPGRGWWRVGRCRRTPGWGCWRGFGVGVASRFWGSRRGWWPSRWWCG